MADGTRAQERTASHRSAIARSASQPPKQEGTLLALAVARPLSCAITKQPSKQRTHGTKATHATTVGKQNWLAEECRGPANGCWSPMAYKYL